MADTTSVQVALRIRPLLEKEISKGYQNNLEVYSELNQVKIKDSDKAFTYNYVFDTNVDQDEFYSRSIQNMIENVFKGYNVTVLAYGQTGTGKSYSMGTACNEEQNEGVIPRVLNDIFLYIQDNFSYDFAVTVSFLEVYKEALYDLLSGKPRDQRVAEIREDAKSIFISGLTEQSVSSLTQALKYLVKGSQRRATSSPNMNTHASHAIFTINISMQKKNDSNIQRTSKFHLVDLAGSERSKIMGATGQAFQEAVNINKGLLALGKVISALGDENRQNRYINYRDSKLTRLLKDSLGGNSITIMIVCISPANFNMEKTLSTLRYAERVQKIKNKPVINKNPKTAEINRAKKHAQQLQLELIGQGGQAQLELLKKEAIDLKQENHMLNIKLSSALNDNTVLIKKLNEIKEDYSVTLNNLNLGIENSDVTAIRENVTELASIEERLGDINSEHIQSMMQLPKHEAEDLGRSGKNVSEWINHELESHLDIVEAKETRSSLLEDRALLYKQLDALKADAEMQENFEVKQLEDDIALKSTQIQDLQQKILDSDEDNRAQLRWDNIQSMSDAKQALKTLFDSVATMCNKKEHTYMNVIKEKEKEIDRLNNQREYEEKLTKSLGRRVEAKDHDEKAKQDEVCQRKQVSKKKELICKVNVDIPPPDEDESIFDDPAVDPDWRNTPLAKRCKNVRGPRMRQEGGCTCKGNCATRNCGCRRFSKTCCNNCKCDDQLCTNRKESINVSGDKENESQSSSKEGSEFMQPTLENKRRSPRLNF